MAVATYTKAGAKAATPVKLDKAVFGISVTSHQLLKDAYLAYLANGRQNLAKAKSRGEVRGGGSKPWRQKGTGRARFGSSRNPIWEGGGVAFGPTGNENYQRKMGIQAKRQAIRQALSLANKEGRIKVIDSFDFKDGKVRQTTALLKKIDANGNTLLVTPKSEEIANRASRNLPGVKCIAASYLNVYDVLNADTIVISKDALEAIRQWLGGSK